MLSLISRVLNGVVAPIVRPVDRLVSGVTRVVDGVVLGATSGLRETTSTVTGALEGEPKPAVKAEEELSPKAIAPGVVASATTLITVLWERVTGKPMPFLLKWALGALVPFLASFAATDRRRS